MDNEEKAFLDLLKQSGPVLLKRLRQRQAEWKTHATRIDDRQKRAVQVISDLQRQIQILESALGNVDEDIPEALEDEPG